MQTTKKVVRGVLLSACAVFGGMRVEVAVASATGGETVVRLAPDGAADRTAQEAIDQIKKNGYAEKYRASGKRITLLGLNFSSKKREIDGFLAEEA